MAGCGQDPSSPAGGMTTDEQLRFRRSVKRLEKVDENMDMGKAMDINVDFDRWQYAFETNLMYKAKSLADEYTL